MKRKFSTLFVFLVCFLVLAPLVFPKDSEQTEREDMYYKYLEFSSHIKGGTITPHWMADGNCFWYAEGEPENTVI